MTDSYPDADSSHVCVLTLPACVRVLTLPIRFRMPYNVALPSLSLSLSLSLVFSLSSPHFSTLCYLSRAHIHFPSLCVCVCVCVCVYALPSFHTWCTWCTCLQVCLVANSSMFCPLTWLHQCAEFLHQTVLLVFYNLLCHPLNLINPYSKT